MVEIVGRRCVAWLELYAEAVVLRRRSANSILWNGVLIWGLSCVQEVHLATVVEILQSIKQSEMSPMLSRIYGAEGGTETLDVLMKYLCDFLSLSISLASCSMVRNGWVGTLLMGRTDTRACRTRHSHPQLRRGRYRRRRRGSPRYIREVEAREEARR